MKISVCIPVFNGEKYIEEAINSVLRQSFSDFELLIVDNKSTDSTVEIVRKIKDNRIRLILNDTNIGLIGNFNKAIASARGKYIKILPADDLIYPDCLKLQCAILDNDTTKKISIVCGRRHIINDTGKVLFSRGYSMKEGEVDGMKAINKLIRKGVSNIIGEPGFILFRKEIIDEVGFFDSDIFYILDLHQYFKMLLRGNLYSMSAVVGAFRVSAGSASVVKISLQRKDNILFIKRIAADKRYTINRINYIIGIINSYLLQFFKKTLYKIVIR